MKKLTLFLLSIAGMAMLSLSSCKKESTKADPVTPAPSFTEAIPLQAKVYTGDATQLSIKTQYAKVLYVNGADVAEGPNVLWATPTINGPVTFNLKAIGDGGVATTQVSVGTYTNNTKLLCRKAGWYMTYSAGQVVDSITHQPIPGYLPVAASLIKDTIYYSPDNSAVRFIYNTGQMSPPGHWEFLNGETQFGVSQTDPNPWNIEDLNATTFKIYQYTYNTALPPHTVSKGTYIYTKKILP